MDAISSPEYLKRQKVFEGQCSIENEDRISHLPEHVLHYILSFLPTKYVVGTSVLSKRWKFLWTSVRNLDFCDEHLYSTAPMSKNYLRRKRSFTKFVDRVLSLQDFSHIHKFSLTCKECDALNFCKWIPTAMRRKVQELVLSISKKPSYMLPYCVLTCESLKILKIEMDASVYIPGSVCFSCLKVLHLKRLTVSSDQPIQEVSLSCPNLEEFLIIGITWLDLKTVNISAPTLQRLTITERGYKDSYECEIKINAENLISLKLDICFSYEYALCNLSSLVDVFIDCTPYYTIPNDTIIHRLISLLKAIYNARSLELPADSIWTLSHPVFSTHMHSLSRLIDLRVARGDCCGKKLVDLLCNMPNIESLLFLDGIDDFLFKGSGRILGRTPKCFLSHLKFVDIKRFRAINEQLWFLKFLVKSVTVVDKFTIKLMFCRYESHVGWMQWIAKQLEKALKGSNCELEFRDYRGKVLGTLSKCGLVQESMEGHGGNA